jgi:hypothetical protein
VSTHGPTSQPAEAALRRALEQQVAALVPVVTGLHAATAHPAVAPTEWHGPASDAYAALELRLRSRVAIAERAVSVALQTSRLALAELGA